MEMQVETTGVKIDYRKGSPLEQNIFKQLENLNANIVRLLMVNEALIKEVMRLR